MQSKPKEYMRFKPGERVWSYLGFSGTFIKYTPSEECDCLIKRDDMPDKEYHAFSWMLEHGEQNANQA